MFIYALKDPDTGACRYIGKTKDPNFRYGTHLRKSYLRAHTKKNCWIKSLLARGKLPVLEILDEVPEGTWEFWEKEYIRLFSLIGFRLTNGTLGGDGGAPTEETRIKMSIARKGKKPVIYPDTAAKQSASKKGMKWSPAVCAQRSVSRLGKPLSAEHRRRIAEGVAKSPVAQAALALGRRKRP